MRKYTIYFEMIYKITSLILHKCLKAMNKLIKRQQHIISTIIFLK